MSGGHRQYDLTCCCFNVKPNSQLTRKVEIVDHVKGEAEGSQDLPPQPRMREHAGLVRNQACYRA
jgi:hypothetical protein